MYGKIDAIVTVALFLFLGTIIILPTLMVFNMPSEITVVGVVNDSNQIVADGVIIDVDDTPQGHNFVVNFIGKTVKVTGNPYIEGDKRIISVKSFKVIKR